MSLSPIKDSRQVALEKINGSSIGYIEIAAPSYGPAPPTRDPREVALEKFYGQSIEELEKAAPRDQHAPHMGNQQSQVS